ncbi:MAG: acetyl-CoA acetyltransferase [Alphaproteobacteria bacterium]|nr:MAG: acetyl-CoA acetyltransferase [Alphaproteobacteria bacterium]
MIEDSTPVLVGCAQFVQKVAPEHSRTPTELLSDVARQAVEDAGDAERILAAVDTLIAVGATTNERGFDSLPVGRLPNAPKSIAKALGINPKELYTTHTGGNTPQFLVNHFAEKIAEGEADVVLATGGEVLASLMARIAKGEDMNIWADDEDPIAPDHILGDARPGVNETERNHTLFFMTNSYPLFEMGWRHHLGHSPQAHMAHLGSFLAPMTEVAAKNPYAWFPVARSAEEISTVNEKNRWVGYPYPKYMNSILRVDQGGAWLMMSVKKARELNVPQDKWVFLHGCADVKEIWHVTERVNYHSSPAIRLMGQKAFQMAGWSVGDVDYIDLYSCFPIAVQLGAHELGLDLDDPRGLTVTGGLPYFGGAGNAYVMCSIAEMMNRLRAKPGSKGLVTANGWVLTKHTMGLYSTEPVEGHWSREDPKNYQSEIDNLPHPTLCEKPEGPGTIETYTVVNGRGGKHLGIVIGRLKNGERFIAMLPDDEGLLDQVKCEDYIGRTGQVTAGEKTNLFVPD